MTMRRLALLLAALALGLGAPGAAHAGGDGRSGDNSAVAINTKDGSSLFKFSFSLKKVLGEIVDNQNAAVAYASCEQCRTTAIAIQIVLVVGSPSTVTPENYAVSVNENCTLCETFSAALQFVVGVDDPSVGLTKQGQRELKEILKEFRALKHQQYTLAEFDAKVRALGDRLRTVLKTQLVSRREHGVEDDDDDDLDESEQDERPAPPQAPPAETTTGTTTDPGTTGTEPATTETAPGTTVTTTETLPTETTGPPPATTAP
jgi:putative peptide zinc metalloprotease protein